MNNRKAAVFIILGQSNAVGHGLPMAEKDKIFTPLKNVFGLNRDNNQSFDNNELIWSGYTSFGMNLAEEQDHTYSVPNCLAALWQKHIDEGNKMNLPDLYVVQIAIGAQGVTENYMWHPDRARKLIPGKLGTVDISLFPFSNHIFSLLDNSFKKKNTEYEIIGLHWRGGENDTSATKELLTESLENIYKTIFESFNSILKNPPVVLHKIVCHERMMDLNPSGQSLENMHYINNIFEKFQQTYKNVSVFDVTTAPQYTAKERGNGIFMEDMVHFTPEVNNWVAQHIIEEYTK